MTNHEADEQVQHSERAGTQPSGEKDERSPPSTHQIPDDHKVEIRGSEENVEEDERVNVGGTGGVE